MPSLIRFGLAFQHLLAVFAGTIFVPVVLGLPIPIALFFAGIATLVFHYFTAGKIPLYLSSSFTVLAGMAFIRQSCVSKGMADDIALCYTCFGAFVIGVVYLVVAQFCVSSHAITSPASFHLCFPARSSWLSAST